MLYGREDEVIEYSEYEKVIVTPDVQQLFAELVRKGLKTVKQPSQDSPHGLRAFVQDGAGVLIELRATRAAGGDLDRA